MQKRPFPLGPVPGVPLGSVCPASLLVAPARRAATSLCSPSLHSLLMTPALCLCQTERGETTPHCAMVAPGQGLSARPLSRSHRVKVSQGAGCDQTGTGSGGTGWCWPAPRPCSPGLPPPPALPLGTEVASGGDSSLLCVDTGRNTTMRSLKRAHRALHVMKVVPLEHVHTGAQDGAQPPCLWTGAWIRNTQHLDIHGGTIQP